MGHKKRLASSISLATTPRFLTSDAVLSVIQGLSNYCCYYEYRITAGGTTTTAAAAEEYQTAAGGTTTTTTATLGTVKITTVQNIITTAESSTPQLQVMATEKEYADILCYKIHSGLTDSEKCNVCDKASKYVVEKDLLYIQEKDKQSGLIRIRRAIVKEERQTENSIHVPQWDGWNALWVGQNLWQGKLKKTITVNKQCHVFICLLRLLMIFTGKVSMQMSQSSASAVISVSTPTVSYESLEHSSTPFP